MSENRNNRASWSEKQLGEILTLNYGWSLPEKKRVVGDFPVFGSNGIVGSHNNPLVPSSGIVVGRKGSAGNVHYSEKPFCPIDTTFFIAPSDTKLDLKFLYFLLLHVNLKRILGDVGVPGLNREMAYRERTNFPNEITEQRKIAAVLALVRRAIEQQERLLALTDELKRVLLHELFTHGLRHEPLKQTELGVMPKSWKPSPLGTCCEIVSGSMSYSDFLRSPAGDGDSPVQCMGVKVSDMNLSGNESCFVTANAIKLLPSKIAERKLIPKGTVVFPKRGAAIATNKKRLTTTWTVLDPNLIGLKPKPVLDSEFLFYWAQTFDLRKITDPGPTPQLNKKDLFPILMPLPPTVAEQKEIANALATVDSKGEVHRRKHAALTALFRTLLHQLMTAQIRVNDLDLKELERAAA